MQIIGAMVSKPINRGSRVLSCSRGVPDRARRRLFSGAALKPNAKEYRSISQKILNASASRYLLMWMAAYMRALLQTDPDSEYLQQLGWHIRMR